MTKLRKLTALFCALGMLVPSIAMATFGSTFGGSHIILKEWKWYHASAWPTEGDFEDPWAASCWLVWDVNSSAQGACANENDNAHTAWYSPVRHEVPEGSLIRSFTCSSTTALTNWNSDGSQLTLQLATRDSPNDTTIPIESSVIAIPDDPSGDELNAAYPFTAQVNYRFPSGQVGSLFLFTPVVTKGTAAHFRWSCIAIVEVPL